MHQNEITKEVQDHRKSTYSIHPIILNRWSPRAMTGESLSDEELFPLFEAARWAPSSYNNQHWRFLYAHRDTSEFDLFFNLLVDANKQWAKNASVLLVIISYNLFDRNQKPAPTHSFDTGAAWQNLALEGSARGLVVHGMQGFDYEKAKKVLEIPDDYTVEAMAAIGKKASKEVLAPELAEKEKPNSRKDLKEIIIKGKFKK
ncbi:MAG: nitroreductase family protein [Chlamydiota bacterium]|jgi:nitroreductase